jgi:dienelactone hydrolase
MATTIHNDSEACCTIPPVKSDYTPKGTIKTYADINSYIVGDDSSKTALICVYDIFGIKGQTQQGADILAQELKARVVMPDFFAPSDPWPLDKFPPGTDEEKKKLQEFFGGPANPAKSVEKLQKVAKQLRADGATKVGTFGFCWGGKVTILAGSGETPVDAVAATHPAMLSADDAKNLSVPLGLFPSGDEPKDVYQQILDIVKEKSFADKNASKYYSDEFHGWAAARADLKNEKNRKDFEDLYSNLAAFFSKAL